jgi:hypothetical protein
VGFGLTTLGTQSIVRAFVRVFVAGIVAGALGACSDPVGESSDSVRGQAGPRLSLDCPNCQSPISAEMQEAWDQVRARLLDSSNSDCYSMGIAMYYGQFQIAGTDVYSWPDWINGEPVYVQASADLATGGMYLSHKSVREDRYWNVTELSGMIVHEAAHLHLQYDWTGEQQVVNLAATCSA